MRVFHSLDEIPQDLGPTVVSIGNFDGVHRGHRWILELIKQRARQLSASSGGAVTSIAVTFEPHPMRLLRPSDSPRLITPRASRLDLLAHTGVDAVLVLPFTPELSRMSGEQFVTAILRDALHAIEVHEGENFRFGYRAHCDTSYLAALGERLGFAVKVHAARHVRGMMVSSSKVRQAILAGDMSSARALLGRPFSIHSTPASGRGIGSRLTVPTINLAPYSELLPADGVYVTRLQVVGLALEATEPNDTGNSASQPPARIFDAVTNAGKRPTFGVESYAIETYLLDYDPQTQPLSLTPETPLELTFLHRLRGEQRFPTPEDLKAQIFRDVANAKRYFHLVHLLGQSTRAVQDSGAPLSSVRS